MGMLVTFVLSIPPKPNTSRSASTFTSFDLGAIQRVIEAYRVFITQQILDPTRQTIPSAIRPDVDNTYVGNPRPLSSLSNVQGYIMAMRWMGAGANLIGRSRATGEYYADGVGDWRWHGEWGGCSECEEIVGVEARIIAILARGLIRCMQFGA